MKKKITPTMTKQDLQQELKEKVKEGIKPSDLKKLKRSKSADDIPTSAPNPPLKKSHSQLEIPVSNQPSKDQIIKQLKQDLLFTQNTANNYLTSLQVAQAQIAQLQEQIKENPTELKTKINQLEDKILELRVEKIKEFNEYYETKQELETELDSNISLAVKEIVKLEDRLKELNKKKLTLQQKLGQASSKNAELELKLINELSNEPNFNY